MSTAPSGNTMPRERKNLVSHGELLSQAELISQSLKDVSRQLHRPGQVWASLIEEPLTKLQSSFGAWILAAFIVGVVLPVMVTGSYLAFFASDQYASETRFAVRGGERGAVDPIASLTGIASSVRMQDSQIVADYIRGRGMVEELEKTLDLRRMFSDPKADFVFGFNPEKSIEKLVKYWWWQVDVSIDAMSGLITVIVRAFTPEDALTITRAVIVASEKLVNDMSDRARRDALRQAQAELALAENTLQEKLRAMRELRDREGILDAGKTSEMLTKLTGNLRLELARLESEYSTQKQSVTENSPQMRVLEARIRSTRDQIRLIEARMTNAPRSLPGMPAANDPVLAESMSRFDRLKLEQDFAQKQYVEAAASLERARIDLETQQIYLTTFLHPVQAQEALYPKSGWIMAAITVICLAIWGAGTGIAVLVRNYAA